MPQIVGIIVKVFMSVRRYTTQQLPLFIIIQANDITIPLIQCMAGHGAGDHLAMDIGITANAIIIS